MPRGWHWSHPPRDPGRRRRPTMNCRFAVIPVSVLGLGLLLIHAVDAQVPNPPDQPQGVEVLARGPVHEAFAEPTEVQPQVTPLVTRQPPDPIQEIPPNEKPVGDNVQWI